MQNEQAFTLMKVENGYATSNDILITWIQVVVKVSPTGPENETWNRRNESETFRFIIVD